ncbi:YheT family hydrolase [Cyanobium sp. N5-Cardenillas]|uniref:YheT family hydrolase n=1 Tax=Cyanobium sp. N5-Cardenillas TaxID=2823720 RepID=UPI0020CCC540|nr:alpha/beta fold hydrolase [Cyanobium sp. N5-Cardenillas]MCP9785112.1 alpha/beta fold hydrolase [Cyanobium sp. N5-Cardenillas]
MSQLPDRLGLPPFRQRSPWIGGDLQTLRDTLRPQRFPPDRAEALPIPLADGNQLVGLLDRPDGGAPIGLVLVLHGLGGSSDGPGPRRLALALAAEGFAVLRLNLRGAGRGRPLAKGTYCALCNDDLRPAVARARQLAAGRPLYGAGISLGGTVLLNAGLAGLDFDGLVSVSSPLDLGVCAVQFERRRNRVYQRWLMQRLREQTLADPGGLRETERKALLGPRRARTIRGFDAAITAPRWGFASVGAYYTAASPLSSLLEGLPLPPTLLLHAGDDPWVPVGPLRQLAAALPGRAGAGAGSVPSVVITPHGGHNGFHAPGDGPACWADRLVVAWLRRLSRGEGGG